MRDDEPNAAEAADPGVGGECCGFDLVLLPHEGSKPNGDTPGKAKLLSESCQFRTSVR